DLVSSLVGSDPKTKRPVLAIPLPEDFTAERLVEGIGGLLAKLSGESAKRAGG
ncbi:MAG: hypothetical protein GY953_22900, partial [bacterium]|nr:hypothetical protein [bacterium]